MPISEDNQIENSTFAIVLFARRLHDTIARPSRSLSLPAAPVSGIDSSRLDFARPALEWPPCQVNEAPATLALMLKSKGSLGREMAD